MWLINEFSALNCVVCLGFFKHEHWKQDMLFFIAVNSCSFYKVYFYITLKKSLKILKVNNF